MKILRTTDKVTLKAGDISVTVSPLSHAQRAAIMEMAKIKAGNDATDLQGQAIKTIQFCVKEVSGLETFDGSPYEPSFKDGILDEDTAGELLGAFSQVDLLSGVANVAMSSLNAPEGVTIMVNGKEIPQKK